MTTTIGASTSYQLTVPSLSETADIQVALKLLSYGSSSDPANNAAISSNSLVGYILSKSPINSPTFTGTVTLPTGTSSVAPLKFVSGTNLTTPVAGTLEYDGKVFYGTPKVNNTTAGRGLLPSKYILSNSSSVTNTFSVTGTTLSSQNYSFFNKGIYLAANTTYFVEISLKVKTFHQPASTGSASASFSFVSPTGTTIALDVLSSLALPSLSTTTVPFLQYISDSSYTSIASPITSSTVYSIIKFSGIISTSSTAGNVYPNIRLAAKGNASGGPDGAPGTSTVTYELYPGSYCIITPLGTSGTEINIGGWA